jgi:hypothetical protein
MKEIKTETRQGERNERQRNKNNERDKERRKGRNQPRIIKEKQINKHSKRRKVGRKREMKERGKDVWYTVYQFLNSFLSILHAAMILIFFTLQLSVVMKLSAARFTRRRKLG